MKISVSLPDTDVDFLDAYARDENASRSAAIQAAVGLLRSTRLERDYDAAFAEWEAGEDAELWESAAADGVSDAPR